METSAQVTIIWLLVILATLCAAQEPLHTINLDCYNDYISEMFCTWNVSNADTNCSHVFLLEYNYRKKRSSYCVPENVPLFDPSSPTECICHISVEFFTATDIYYIQVKSHGGSSQNETIEPANKVKPKTPVNVTIEHVEDETGIVCWDSRYTHGDYLFRQLIFEVQTSTIQEPKEVKVTTLHQVESCFVIRKRLLRRRQNYAIKVRSKPDGIYYNGVWSEWSSAAVWHNDYDLRFHDIMVIVIPSSASVISICIFLCSACICCCKKWQRTIPDPGRSQLLFTLMDTSQHSYGASSRPVKNERSDLIGRYGQLHHSSSTQGPVLHSDINCNNLPFTKRRSCNTSICGNWLEKLPSRNRVETNQNSGNLITVEHLQHFERAEVLKFFLIPEITIVEKPAAITPLHDDTNSVNEPAEEDEARDLGVECDLINQMFLEILQGETDEVLETDNAEIDNAETDNAEIDNADSLEKQDPNRFTVLADFCFKSTLVHSGYTNGNLPVNTSQNIFSPDGKLGNQKGFPDYSPEVHTDYAPSHGCSADTYKEYNSFTDREHESRQYDEPKCLQTISSRNEFYHKTEPTWFMPYTCANNCQIKPLSDHYHPVGQKKTTNSMEVYSCLFQVSDYQSCDTAIEPQGNSV